MCNVTCFVVSALLLWWLVRPNTLKKSIQVPLSHNTATKRAVVAFPKNWKKRQARLCGLCCSKSIYLHKILWHYLAFAFLRSHKLLKPAKRNSWIESTSPFHTLLNADETWRGHLSDRFLSDRFPVAWEALLCTHLHSQTFYHLSLVSRECTWQSSNSNHSTCIADFVSPMGRFGLRTRLLKNRRRRSCISRHSVASIQRQHTLSQHFYTKNVIRT